MTFSFCIASNIYELTYIATRANISDGSLYSRRFSGLFKI